MEIILQEIIHFFRAQKLVEILGLGEYHRLWTTSDGLKIVLIMFVPCLIIYELIYLWFTDRLRAQDIKINLLSYFWSRLIQHLTVLGLYTTTIQFFTPLALFKLSVFVSILFGVLLFEFLTYVEHYLSHKVRLLWCMHAVHHAPEKMNVSVTLVGFGFTYFLAVLIKLPIPLLLGVNPAIFGLIIAIYRIWGDLGHVSEHFLPNGKLGILDKWFITPEHHRMHHGRNPIYIDINFGAVLNIWDRIFKTFRPQLTERPIYGLARPVDMNNFWDVYLGEFRLLWLDIRQTPRLKNKILYLFMPPGWHPSQ